MKICVVGENKSGSDFQKYIMIFHDFYCYTKCFIIKKKKITIKKA